MDLLAIAYFYPFPITLESVDEKTGQAKAFSVHKRSFSFWRA